MRVIVPGPPGWQSSLPIQMTRSPNTSLRAIAVFMMMPPQMIAHERIDERQRSGTAQPFRCGASSPIDQCSDIAPEHLARLQRLTLHQVPSSRLLAAATAITLLALYSGAGLGHLRLVSARHRRP